MATHELMTSPDGITPWLIVNDGPPVVGVAAPTAHADMMAAIGALSLTPFSIGHLGASALVAPGVGTYVVDPARCNGLLFPSPRTDEVLSVRDPLDFIGAVELPLWWLGQPRMPATDGDVVVVAFARPGEQFYRFERRLTAVKYASMHAAAIVAAMGLAEGEAPTAEAIGDAFIGLLTAYAPTAAVFAAKERLTGGVFLVDPPCGCGTTGTVNCYFCDRAQCPACAKEAIVEGGDPQEFAFEKACNACWLNNEAVNAASLRAAETMFQMEFGD